MFSSYCFFFFFTKSTIVQSLLYQQLASHRPMFAPKRSRKEKQGTLCSVQGSVFVSPLSPSSSLEALSSNQTKGGGSTMALFPERCLSAIYVREKRRENKGEKWRKYIYRGRGATLGELTFETGRMSGRDGTLRI